ncbi:hypothetical protein TSUD_384030 [Trifolium subterraneum]|uniref:Uncharacterized protein n=1 Tax=Trifolium subterraneum TaxID=3900 RepID=A0A2Z6NHW8_TRISU|nr:hypothetical protein TSUD_384030 [Trifolium subterraneum]
MKHFNDLIADNVDLIVKATIDRYKKACSDSSGAGSASEANAQELDLHNNNQLLRAKIAESERNHHHHHNINMSVLPGGTNYESMQSHQAQQQQQYDSRGYFQVSGLQPSSQYGRQDHMSLQLV